MRLNAVAVVVAGALLLVGCDQVTPDDPVPDPSTVPATTAAPSSPSPSPSPSTPEPTVSTSAASPSPPPTPTPAPIGSGTITLDGVDHVTTGDCVVSTPALAAGPLHTDATVTLAVTTAVGAPGAPLSVRASTDDGVSVRVDADATADGAQSWAAAQVVAGLADPGDDGRAALTLAAEVTAAMPPPTLPVATPTPQAPAPPTDAAAAASATPAPTPSPTPPRRTRPDPVPGMAPTDAPSRQLAVIVQCRVTSDAL